MGLIEEVPGKTPTFTEDSPNWADKLTVFYTLYLEAESGNEEALASFGIPEDAGTGFYAFLEHLEKEGPRDALLLKGQVAGPVTAGLYLTSRLGHNAFYDAQLRDLIVKTTAMQARWQALQLGRFNVPAVIFIDEPALAAYGTSSHVALQRDSLVEALAGVVDGIKAGGGLPGAHSCSGVEWPVFFESGCKVLSFDAYNYFTSLQVFAPAVADFLEQGGILAWGIVPTNEDVYRETAESLAAKLEERINELAVRGVDRNRLYRQAWVTPVCGTGVLDKSMAEYIYKMTAEIAFIMKR